VRFLLFAAPQHAFVPAMVVLALWTPEQIEATVNERRLVPKSLLRPMSPEARALLDERLAGLSVG
jgi:hypothetical protein